MTSLMLEEALSAAAVASRQLAVLDACLPAGSACGRSIRTWR